MHPFADLPPALIGGMTDLRLKVMLHWCSRVGWGDSIKAHWVPCSKTLGQAPGVCPRPPVQRYVVWYCTCTSHNSKEHVTSAESK